MAENQSINIIAILHNEKNQILTMKRKLEPFKNYLSLPGGYVSFKERIEDTLKREVNEKLSLIIEPLEILGVYSNFKDNNDNEILINIVFICLIIDYNTEKKDEKDIGEEEHWVDINNISKHKFAFDHKMIVEDYLKWRENSCTFWSSKIR